MTYLKGTLDCGLKYAADSESRLYGYADLDWVGSVEDRNRTSGCCFSLGSCVISWISRNQTNVSLSTTDAEYIEACSNVVKQYGFASYWQDCLMPRWMQLISIMTTRVASS